LQKNGAINKKTRKIAAKTPAIAKISKLDGGKGGTVLTGKKRENTGSRDQEQKS